MTKTEVDVRERAELLRALATHFVYDEWEYTRDLGGMKHIRYTYDYTGYNVWWRRWLRAINQVLLWRLADWEKQLLSVDESRWKLWKHRLSVSNAWISLKVWGRKDRNLPDGVLDRGNVLVFWEETGDYLNMVSPAVGALLADWMTAEPENEYAIKIAELMDKPPSYAKGEEDDGS